MKTKVAVLRNVGLPRPYAQSKPLVIEELILDEPRAGEVLVQIKAAGLCHSDLSVIDGSRVRPVPMGIGHEAAGIVEKSAESDLPVGTRVILVFIPSCGNCTPCATGRPALCVPGATSNGKGELLGGGTRWKDLQGAPVYHQLGVSAFSERVVVSKHSCVPIPYTEKELSYAEMALFGCGVLTGAGACFNTAKVAPGSSACVVGLGGVGLSALLALKATGATPIGACDLVEAKLELARKLGATHTFNPSKCSADDIKAATNGGFESVFEMAGSVPALELAYQITARGGTTVTAGLPHPSKTFSIPCANLVADEKTIKGSYIGSAVPKRDIPRMIAMYKQGYLPVDSLLDQEIRLDQINEAFDRLAEGKAVRQVIIF